jgi:hypothetical protein
MAQNMKNGKQSFSRIKTQVESNQQVVRSLVIIS